MAFYTLKPVNKSQDAIELSTEIRSPHLVHKREKQEDLLTVHLNGVKVDSITMKDVMDC